jgi:hypothetical protein
MRRQKFILLAILLCAPAAFALNNRSAVAVAGLDTNPCTVASPCRSFGVAVTATAPGGEIIALDSAGYGPFTIDRALTVSGVPGVHAAITVNSGNGIDVAPAFPDKVMLRNLVLIGAGGTNGIYQTNGVDLTIQKCMVRGFLNFGIFSGDVDGHLVVDHCTLLENDFGLYADGGTNPSEVLVRDSTVQGSPFGIVIGYHTDAEIVNSTITHNNTGIEARNDNPSAWATRVVVENCTVAHNSYGVTASATTNAGNSATVAVSHTVLAYNQFGVLTAASAGATAAVVSFGNNRFVGNGSDGTLSGTIAFH